MFIDFSSLYEDIFDDVDIDPDVKQHHIDEINLLMYVGTYCREL